MANAQGFTIHPMTMDAASQSPVYSADDVRSAVTALACAPDGSAFGGLQGIRAGSPSPLAEISGTTVTVHAHSGWLSPWGQAYSYSLDRDATINIDNTTGGFKIAVVVSDQAAGHGTGQTIGLAAFPSTTSDSVIPGLVVAQINAGVASDTSVALQNDVLVRASTVTQLNGVASPDGCRALLADGTEYRRVAGAWVPRTQTLTATFHSQNTGSFAISGMPSLIVHTQEGFIEPDMPGVVCHSSVSNFPFLQYSSGVKPSQSIDMGRLFLVDNNLQYQKTITWNTDGSLTINNLGSSDSLIPLYRRIAIPAGVTFS